MASMTHRGFAVGGDLAELAARLGRAPGDAARVEAERTVESQRERLRQERLDAERAAELDRQRADQERQRMDQERTEAERLELERKSEEHERQCMELERIEVELGRSVKLERQRVERECTEKARAERRTKLDANAAVWVPAHIGVVEPVERECTRKLRLLERLNAGWAEAARHREAERDRREQKPRCGANEGGEALKAMRHEAVRVEAERIARSYGVRLADDDSTFAAKVRMVIQDKAAEVVDKRDEERAKRFLPPAQRARKTKKGPPPPWPRPLG